MVSVLSLFLLGAAAAGDWKERLSPPPPSAPVSVVDDRLWVAITASSPAERSRAAELGLSIEEVSGRTAIGVATPAALARLRAAGFAVVRQVRLSDGHPMGFPSPDESYHDYARVESELAQIASQNPGFASLVNVGKSLRGLNITAVRFNTTARENQSSAKPGVVLFGGHHAREHLAAEVPLLLAKWLAANKDKPEVRSILETRDLYIAPLANPDGSEFDISGGDYHWQRKNMRPNDDGTIGVDLNRNYDSHWGESGSSRYPGDDTYLGKAPFSEPETQAVRDFVLARPNLKMMVSYHTYSELILYPWSWTAETLPDAGALKAYKAMADQMAEWTGYRAMQSGSFYPSSGDTCDWAWAARNIFCFTFELTPKSASQGGFYPGAAAIEPTLQKNIAPALYLSGLADNPLRAGASASLTRAP